MVRSLDITREVFNMTDVHIRRLPNEVITAPDARAARLGLSRSAYLRRRLAQETMGAPQRVTAMDLAVFAETFCDLTDPEVMKGAWE